MQSLRKKVSTKATINRRFPFRGISPYLFIVPVLAIVVLFVYYPVIRTVYISFYDWALVGGNHRFVGLRNYIDLLHNPSFRAILIQSVYYMGLAVLGSFLFPVGLALLTLQIGNDAEAGLYQSLIFLPTVVAVSIATLVWLWFYLPSGGLFNAGLELLGVSGLNWLNDARTALPAVALVANWKFMGFNYLIALAGFKAIPQELLAAAKVDGAQGWSLLYFVIFPLFAPSAIFLFIITLIQALDHVFVPIDILTVGGPAGATSNLFYAIYQDAFQYFRAGRSAAKSVVLMVSFSILILWQFRMFEGATHYEK